MIIKSDYAMKYPGLCHADDMEAIVDEIGSIDLPVICDLIQRSNEKIIVYRNIVKDLKVPCKRSKLELKQSIVHYMVNHELRQAQDVEGTLWKLPPEVITVVLEFI